MSTAAPPEEWRPVVGYEGLYEVSSMGRVRSLDRRLWASGPKMTGHYRTYRGSVIRGSRHNSGYRTVSLRGENGPEKLLVHVLVLEAFVGLRPPGLQVRHLNGVRSDNRLHNLAWGTVQENASDRRTHGTALRGERHPSAKLTADDVRAIRSAKASDVRVLCQQLSISRANAWLIRTRKLWASIE